jgi:hypothetical protein
MLDNSITLVVEAAGGAATVTKAVSLTDTDNGRTIRRKAEGGGTFYDLTISSEETRAKDGIISDRYLVRIDNTVPDPVLSTAPAAVVSAYLVFVLPRRSDIGNSHVGALWTALQNLLYDGSVMRSTSDSDAILARLITGEA